MGDVDEAFGKPHNWCDRSCERCPLSSRCDLALALAQERWRDEARGRDPDAPEQMAAHMVENLERATKILKQCAAEDGIDLSGPPPKLEIGLDARRRERASLKLVSVLADARKAAGLRPGADTELERLSGRIHAKVARIGTHLGRREVDHELWHLDTAPNLLLLEHYRDRCASALEREPFGRDDAVRAAFAELDRLLRPLFAQVSERSRAHLAMLIATGAAPSPFALVAER